MKVLKKNGKFYAKYGALAKGTTPSWWNNCVLLTHFDGDDGATSAIDSSDSNHTLTFNSDVEIDTAIKKFGTGSLLCKPSNPTVTTDAHADFNFYNKSFTISYFFYLPTIDMNQEYYGIFSTVNTNGININRFATNTIMVRVNGTDVVTSSITYNPNAGWHHFEFNREHSTNTYRTFLDGVKLSEEVHVEQVANANQAFRIGMGRDSYNWFTNSYGNGQLDEFRILNGICEHTENFTPPTQAYKNLKPSTLPIKFDQGWTNEMYDTYASGYDDEDTTILLGEFSRVNGSTSFIDKTKINTLSIYGQAEIDTTQVSPFNDYSGVLKLQGNDSSAVYISDNSNWDVNSTDTVMSIESWIKFDSIAPTLQAIFSVGDTGNNTGSTRVWCFRLREDSGRKLEFTYCNNDSWTTKGSSVITTPGAGEWHHYAMTINKGTITFYFDGVQIGSSNFSLNIFPEYGGLIGAISYTNPTWQNPCAFSEVRVVNGTLPWTDTFTVPTSRYRYTIKTLVAYWSFDKDLLTDDSGNNHTLTNVNNVAKVAGKSNYAASFNGVDNYLTTDLTVTVSNDYTFAGWCKVSDKNSQQCFLGAQDDTVGNTRCYMGLRDGKYWTGFGETQRYSVSATEITNDTYFHWIVTISSNVFTFYINGTQVDTAGFVGNGNCLYNLYIGALNYNDSLADSISGQLDEILILKDQSLTQENVTDLYNDGKGRYYRKKFNVTPFSPNVLNNLVLWLDADKITGLNDSDTVSTWQDQSLLNNDATQSNATCQPIYKTNVLNGKSVIRFDGSDDYLNLANMGVFNNVSMFVIAKASTFKTGEENYNAIVSSKTWDVGYFHWDCYNDGYPILIYHRNGIDRYRIEGSNPLSTNVYYIHELLLKESTDVKYLINGSLISSLNWGATTFNFSNMAIGWEDIDRYWNGDIAEILIYDSILSDSDRKKVEKYLNDKYALF